MPEGAEPSDQPTFGERLKNLREAKGWDMREARSRTGLTMSHLQYLETDQRPPGMATLRRLSEGYGVPINELASEEEQRDAEAAWQETLDQLLGPDSYLPESEKEELRRRYRPD